MKILLTAVNAKYIHTNPAIYALQAYASARLSSCHQNSAGGCVPGDIQVETAEFTINDRYSDVLAGILERRPDVVALSTYIWNVDRVRRLIRDLRSVREDQIQIWVGGPEATYAPGPFLLEDGADLCMLGEGEKTFTGLCAACYRRSSEDAGKEQIPGIAYLEDGKLISTGMARPVDLDSVPFLYRDLSRFENRILYYESSRGCPFGCAYCLSGKERGIRYRSLEKVDRELGFFLDAKVPQVKFIDRTFNADAERAMHIWTFLKEHDNGVTNFHFEIEADRMTEEELALLSSLRPGLVQLEIGVQSANAQTLKSVHRNTSLDRIAHVMETLTGKQNINLHLDLIAGLPYEGLESYRHSFQKVWEMRPHQLQPGFLKLLAGTELADRSCEYGLVCSKDAPYEVLKTRWLSYEELLLLHRISDRVEEYVNSQGFRRSLPLAERLFPDAFALFEALAEYYRDNGYEQRPPSVFKRYEIFSDFLKKTAEKNGNVSPAQLSLLLETVRFDQYLHTHPSRRMTAEETFVLEEGPVRYAFDYRETSPVNGEAAYRLVAEGDVK